MKGLKGRVTALVEKLAPKPEVQYTWVTKWLPDAYAGLSYWVEITPSNWPREIQQHAGEPPAGVVTCDPPERRVRHRP